MTFSNEKGAFKNRVWSGQIKNTGDIIDPNVFLKQCGNNIVQKIGDFFLNFRSPVKIVCDLCCDYIVKKGDTELVCEIYHSSKMTKICVSDDFGEWYSDNVVNPMQKKMEEFQLRDSGKALYRIKYMQVNINKYNPTNGGSSYIPLPNNIANKKAVVNVKNNDVKCFIWSILASLYPAKSHPERVSWYPKNHSNIFNLSGIKLPMSLGEISKFEKQNDISINVYGLQYDRELKEHVVVGPLHYTKCKKDRHVNLLYFKDGERAHYASIKSLSRLLSSQLSKHRCSKFICDRCLQYFGREYLLLRHEEDCKLMDAVKIEMPTEDDKWIKFQNFGRKERHPFVVYADFECLTVPIHTCEPSPDLSYTVDYQRHVPCAVAYQVVCAYDDSLSYYNSYRGPNATAWFMSEMKKVAAKVEEIFENTVPMNMTENDLVKFNNAEVCHICGKYFENHAAKVRDHNHLTGAFRGAAHNTCNLEYTLPNFIPIFFHNLTGYDSHLFLRELGTDEEEIILIPNNEEQFISFSKKVGNIYLRFLDSYRFLSSALDKLVSYMEPESFILMKKRFSDPVQFNLLTRKGVFCYDYVNSWDKLEETQLPPKETFYSQLKSTHITDNEYAHAVEVWNTFDHKNLGEYTDLYLQTDVLLLADVFENFRNICMQSYALDPTYPLY